MTSDFDLARAIFGQQVQAAQAPSATSASRIEGEARSDSRDGKVLVALRGDTVSGDGAQAVEMPTSVAVKQGQAVVVTITGNKPMVTDVVGWGDSVRGSVDALGDEVDQAVQDAKDASEKAEQVASDLSSTAADLSGKITDVSTSVDGLTTKVEGAVEDAGNALKQVTQVSQDVSGVRATAEQALTTAQGTQETVTSLSVTVDGVKADVSQATETASDALEKATSVEATAEGIRVDLSTNYVSKSDASTTYATKTELSATSESLSASISETAETAQAAVDKATEVEATASGLSATVSEVSKTADSAMQKATTVEQTASGLTVRITQAERGVETAQSTASAAQSTASDAKDAANAAQSTASSANTTASRAQSTANAAQSAAEDAAKTATNYLSFSSGGLVVGDMTSGSLGYNTLTDGESVQIRDGETVLSSFSADGVKLHANPVETGDRASIEMFGGNAWIVGAEDEPNPGQTVRSLYVGVDLPEGGDGSYSSVALTPFRPGEGYPGIGNPGIYLEQYGEIPADRRLDNTTIRLNAATLWLGYNDASLSGASFPMTRLMSVLNSATYVSTVVLKLPYSSDAKLRLVRHGGIVVANGYDNTSGMGGPVTFDNQLADETIPLGFRPMGGDGFGSAIISAANIDLSIEVTAGGQMYLRGELRPGVWTLHGCWAAAN